MKTRSCLWAIVLFAVIGLSPSMADNLQLTLDLRNNIRTNTLSGGTWQLFARVVETGDGTEGNAGVAGIRVLLDRISAEGITFNPAINPNGTATVQALPGDAEGTVEIVYRQDLAQPTLAGVGVPPENYPNRDTLIASGSWPPGPRPVFGNDGATLSSGEFLSEGGAAAVIAENVSTSIFTLGDMNRSGTITSLDTAPYVLQLPGASTNAYNAAADINQSGHVSNLDTIAIVAIFGGPVTAAVTAVPEPGSATFVLVACILALPLRFDSL